MNDQISPESAMLPELAGSDSEADAFAALSADAAEDAADELDAMRAVLDVPVRVQAVLGRARMPVGELLRLTAGMVVELDRRVGEAVDIFVNDRLIARGEVVLIENLLGVTLTEIVQQDR